jgi:hypothetical protein
MRYPILLLLLLFTSSAEAQRGRRGAFCRTLEPQDTDGSRVLYQMDQAVIYRSGSSSTAMISVAPSRSRFTVDIALRNVTNDFVTVYPDSVNAVLRLASGGTFSMRRYSNATIERELSERQAWNAFWFELANRLPAAFTSSPVVQELRGMRADGASAAHQSQQAARYNAVAGALLRRHSISPGETYGGTVVFQKPDVELSVTALELDVHVGGETHSVQYSCGL